ncbi:methyltransferase domain-containing protein [Halalkalicoccus subterraneus]|uniref:methyltransferase domain-containing protein n=1 Tax=Halalkalicoccus subterraneus TaxID=2675002 RepID=UPI000EFB5261|nr:methyltransferase domain-containing protein [Halalkalicoccus subterraneus]
MILLVHGDREYLREPGEELQTDLGIVQIPEDAAPGDVLESHLGEEFRVRHLRGPDLFNHLERTGAPMLPRDVGLVLGETGIAAGDRVLDAGTGTGVLATYMGRVGADVLTYERNSDFAEVARENVALGGVAENVTVQTGDLTDEIGELSGFDALTLDTEDASAVVARADELLVPGGFLAVYSPFVEATRDVVETAREGLSDVRAVETVQRELDVDSRGTRPSTGPVGHSGYLVFARNG